MIKAILLTAVYCLISCITQAQFADNFNDGDFSANPHWTGNAADWIVNSSLQLQSNNTIANSTFYLSTTSTLSNIAQWEMYMALTFNTSSANYVDVFINGISTD